MLYTWKFVINQCYLSEKKIVYVNGFSLLLTKIQIPYYGLSNGCSGLILLHSSLDLSSHLPSISFMKMLSSVQVFPFLGQSPPSPGWVPPILEISPPHPCPLWLPTTMLAPIILYQSFLFLFKV